VAEKEQRQEVGLVDDLVQPEGLVPVEAGPFKEIDHFSDYRARQIAGRSQLQAVAVGRLAKQDQSVARDT
jgi:hypothetical protein